MNLSKQSLLGATMLLFGGVTFVAMMQQSQPSDAKQQDIEEVTQDKEAATGSKKDADGVTLTAVDAEGEKLAAEVLAKEIETEAKLAETKKQQRADQSNAQDKQAKDFIQQREDAKKQALMAEQSKYKATSKKETESKVTEPKVTEPKATITPVEKVKKIDAPAKSISHPKVANRDDAIQQQQPIKTPANSPTTYYAKKGDSMYRIAKNHGISLEVLSEANDVYYLDPLMYGQKLIIPSKSQVSELAKTAKKAQNKRGVIYRAKQKKEEERKAAAKKKRDERRKAAAARIAKAKAAKEKVIKAAKDKAEKARLAKQESAKKAAAKVKVPVKKAPIKKETTKTKTSAAQKKLQKARITAKQENARGTFGVQVALAADQLSADKVAAKFKKAGYRTKTSQTTRGVRVIIGPERGKIAALALKDKINSDSRTGVRNSWVLYWR